MLFEYDTNKSQTNKDKHGIDFETAKLLWADQDAIILPTNYINEDRHIVIGKIDSYVWTGVITFRWESIRIISVRRANIKEKLFYETTKNKNK